MRREPFPEGALAILILLGLFLGGSKLYEQFNTNRAAFYTELSFVLTAIVLGIVVVMLLGRRANNIKAKFILNIEKAGLNPIVSNFINRFGIEKSKLHNWGYRDHNFKWDRLEDFRRELKAHGIGVSPRKWEDTLYILRHFIQTQEENLTRDSVGIAPKRFSSLDGKGFEDLLYRLFVAEGYTVQRTGKSGDQGADLITNKAGERTVVQAKRYQNSVSNSAVQEAVAAQKMYDCNKASVVTTSEFTAGARTLAQKNGVELIEKSRLQQLLLQHLKESWT